MFDGTGICSLSGRKLDTKCVESIGGLWIGPSRGEEHPIKNELYDEESYRD